MTDRALDGLLFDGRTAAAAPVRLTITAGWMLVATPAGEPVLEAPLDTVAVTERFASAPRQVTFRGGEVVEVADGAALAAALAAAGGRAGLVERLQQRWPAAVVALLASVALLALGYRHGLPAAARLLAGVVPASAERRLGDGVLEVLERSLVGPSALSEEERAGAEARIAAAARLGAPGLEYRVVFRAASRKPGVNAFALPGGTVVILDELVRRTAGDDRLLAVVGHELGHVARHHATQAFLRAAGLGAAASLLWGDFSGQLASIPVALAILDGSRDAERQADDGAVEFLRAAGRPPRAMFDALCLLSAVQQEAGLSGLPDLLSTHPDVEERLARVGEPGSTCAPAKPPPAAEACPPAPR